mmetsp:Transcript_99317/g.309477  ORF Transcript_99317/g.309477 Transcript_99317/m.309477 type:complete len:230 (-) Transcript_99317:943-1632(-)
MHSLASTVALMLAFHRLEGVEGNLPGEARVAPVPGVRALVARVEVLKEQVVDVHLGDVQQCPTPPEVEVLLLVLVRLPVLALLRALLVDLEGLLRQHLDGTVHAPVAVVEVDRGLRVARVPPVPQDLVKPGREEDGVRVDLHRPLVLPSAGVLHDLRPEPDEDVRVEGRVPLAAELHLEAALNDVRLERLLAAVQDDALVAVDRVLVALEYAHLLGVLVLQQALLVAPR